MAQTTRRPTVHIQDEATDRATLDAENIAKGSPNIVIGVAPLYPAEYIPLEIQQLAEPPSTQGSVKPGFGKKRKPQ